MVCCKKRTLYGIILYHIIANTNAFLRVCSRVHTAPVRGKLSSVVAAPHVAKRRACFELYDALHSSSVRRRRRRHLE